MARLLRGAKAIVTSWCVLHALCAVCAPARALVDSPRLVGRRAFDEPLPSTAPTPDFSTVPDWEPPPAPVVATRSGRLRGALLYTRRRGLLYAFRGIRYALPPVGPLRFQPPQPYPAWEDIVNVTQDGPACPQENGYSFPTDEDCLFLNIYTTQLPTARKNPKRPVFFYIHMGGWYGNNARSDNLGPQYLADKELVIVTVQYRLGALGFISTGDDVLPGNYGMKDQVMAMRWVKENINAFGGDPNRVTLAGYGSGGASVLFHLASPLSRGLFQQTMAFSPTVNAQGDMTFGANDPMHLARRQARAVNCTFYETSQQIKDCLMALPAQDIGGSLASSELFDWGIDPVLMYFPVVEPHIEGSEPFLSEDIIHTFLSGNFSKVPLVIGRTRDEFDWRATYIYENQNLREDLSAKWDQTAPKAFMYVGKEDSDRISKNLRKFYLNNSIITPDGIVPLGWLYSDSIVAFGTDRVAKILALRSEKPVYYYNFAYQGRYSYQYRGNTTIPYGVMHQDDMMYFFYLSAIFPYFEPDAPEMKTMERSTQLIWNFVLRGNPTIQSDPLLDNVTWTPMSVDRLEYLEFGDNLKMREGLNQERVRVWEENFPAYWKRELPISV